MEAPEKFIYLKIRLTVHQMIGGYLKEVTRMILSTSARMPLSRRLVIVSNTYLVATLLGIFTLEILMKWIR